MTSIGVFKSSHREVPLSGKHLCIHQVKCGTAIAVNAKHQHPLVGDGFLIQNVGTPHVLKTNSTEVVTICIPESLIRNQRFEECLTPRDFLFDRAVSNLLVPSNSVRLGKKSIADEIVDSLLVARDSSSQNFYLQERSTKVRSREITMRNAREFILSHLAEPISVPQVADCVSVSAFHFHRQFTEWHGMTPGRYIVQEKIRRACRRLVLRDDPVSQVALDCGFLSPTSFVCSFRSVTGMTPSLFRTRQGFHRFDLEFYDGIS